MPVIQTFNNNNSYKNLEAAQQTKLLPFLRAWSLGIKFDEASDLGHYQIQYGHHLRQIVQSVILEEVPDSLKIYSAKEEQPSTSIVSIETLANLDVPINVIASHFANSTAVQVNNDESRAVKVNGNVESLHNLIRNVCEKASSRTIDDSQIDTNPNELIPYYTDDQYEQTEHQTITLYNHTENLGEGYSFAQDCQPHNYARHIHMSTLEKIFGFNLVIEVDGTPNQVRNKNANQIDVYARHQGLAYDPDPKQYAHLFENNQTPVIHDGTCGYHTILLLLIEAWKSLTDDERSLLIGMKEEFLLKDDASELIHSAVKSSKPEPKKDLCIYYSSESMFSAVRPICYGTLLIAVTTSIAVMGWAAFLAMLASPAGPAVITGLLICILLTELTALKTNLHASYAYN